MITIISSTKSLDFEKEIFIDESTEPVFMDEVRELVGIIKNYNVEEIAKRMKISNKLSKINYNRFQSFYDQQVNTRQAIFAFSGEVYRAINPFEYDGSNLEFAQKHIRILSGLFGVLRPLDNIKEYRLEMATKLRGIPEEDLYKFWTKKITQNIVNDLNLKENSTILNLASLEYSKSIDKSKLGTINVYDVEFKENREGKYRIIGTYAKRARGLMVTYIVKNNIHTIEDLKNFKEEGYCYNKELSGNTKLVFTREIML
ncbi:peroxide stress protein YaaA [Clostridium subterminale]|uniref:UPF0246 protein GCM10008908_29950 n=1 Tax=Clostridium subterminale TaxID=1550 RepID=A0ABP3W579_CLOSU